MKLYRAMCSPSVILSSRKLYFDLEAIFKYADTGVSRSAGRDEHIGIQLAFFCFKSDATSSNDGEGCGEKVCEISMSESGCRSRKHTWGEYMMADGGNRRDAMRY